MTGFLDLITGSFAMPAAENPTVAMVEAAYRHHGLSARYLNCEVAPEALGDAVRGARAMGWAGFNCSIPHKVAVIEHLDGLGESAEVIGAVNCVVDRDGRWIGENTDGQGFVSALRTVVDPAGRSLVIFGAGGAARAIAVEAALAGAASITVVNRGRERGEELAALLAGGTGAEAAFVSWDDDVSVPDGTDIVVNATSIGLFPDVDARVPVDVESLRPGMVVADVIPNPPQHTSDPRRRGARLLGARRARDARQPGRDRDPPLDRGRPGPGGHARGARGRARPVTLRVGVIGAGIMGADHVATLHRFVSRAEVSAVADVDLARAQAAASVAEASAVGDASALIRDPAVEAVVIASHDSTHAELARACVAAGKPVLCEKPLAPTVAECEAARRGGHAGVDLRRASCAASIPPTRS